jgi:tRNA (guanosine-2'-O-)-methyltransferase
MSEKEQLCDFLEKYLSPNKKGLFDRILPFRTRHFTAIVEDIYQEHNAGAIVRNCDVFGIQDVHIIETHHSFRVSHSIAKGAIKWVDMHIYDHFEDNIDTCMQAVKEQGYQVIGATPHENSCLLADFDITKKTAFYFGTEKNGISQKALSQMDGFVKIPMKGFSESLNVSVSVAIILHYLTLKLQASNIAWQLSQEELLDKRFDWIVKSVRNPDYLIKYFYENVFKP